MGLIPEEKIAEIRDRTDIVAVIGEYVALKRAGNSHKGLCPFHNEKSPSFNVNAQKQFYHCFGCSESGDVFSFVQKVEGKSFLEVARELAKKAGIDLPEGERTREQIERQRAAESEREKLLRLNRIAVDFYRERLTSTDGEAARKYLEKRGIGDQIAEHFSIGYAPAGFEALTRHLEGKKVPHELAERAGLIRRRESARLQAGAPPTKATHFDVFVDRVVYALTSPMGDVIGFGGRILEAKEDQPKYKNSPETPLYKKGENLFGLHLAKHGIRRSGRALVVEGNFDVMTLHERGIDYAVAPQGTAITDAQVALLKRFAREVVLMLDADPAGRKATLRVIHLFVDAELPCKVAQLRAEGGKKVDPDDLARNDLPRLQKMIDGAADAIEFYFDQVASTSDPSVPGRVQAIEECAPILRAVRDPLARNLYIDRLAAVLKIEVGLIRRTLRGGSGAPVVASGNGSASAPDPYSTAVPAREIAPLLVKLLALLAQHATLIARMTPDVLESISDVAVRALLTEAAHKRVFVPQAALEHSPPEIRAALARAFLSEEFAQLGDVKPETIFDEIVRKMTLPGELAALEAERKRALVEQDMVRVRELTAKILRPRKGQS